MLLSIGFLEKSARELLRWRTRRVIRRADYHRDRSEWLQAIPYYLQSHTRLPWRNDLLIQAGNCFKEVGNFNTAVDLYRRAVNDPHQSDEALRQIRDVDDIVRADFSARNAEKRDLHFTLTPSASSQDIPLLQRSITYDGSLVPSIIISQVKVRAESELEAHSRPLQTGDPPEPYLDPFTNEPLTYLPGIYLIQLGNFAVEFCRTKRPLLVGIFSLRVKVVSYSRADMLSLHLGGALISESKLSLVDSYPDGRYLYIANVWLDSQELEAGNHVLRALTSLEEGTDLALNVQVSIAHLPDTFDLPDSDAFAPSLREPGKEIAEQIKSRDAIVRSTSMMMKIGEIRSVLVIRADQLGDLSASLPAIRRLREELPTARIVALVALELVDIVIASEIVDAVVGVATEYSKANGQRTITTPEATRLRLALCSEIFDVAIDLCPGEDTRHLLLLANARDRVGFLPQKFGFLDFGLEVVSRSKANDHSTESHAALVQSLVDGYLLKCRPLLPPVPRRSKVLETLPDIGLEPGRYVVIHCGARHSINRWPQDHFIQLGSMLEKHIGLPTVIFLEDDLSEVEKMVFADNPGMIALGKLKLGEFDEIVSNAYIMIGNDSGPKHLAAVRGIWTASIHINRLNWDEWGQNGHGLIISKKVPCGGCALNDERLCGQDVACLRSITVDEVCAAILKNMPILS